MESDTLPRALFSRDIGKSRSITADWHSCELDLEEVGQHAKQGMGREFAGGYRDRPDTWLKIRLGLEDGT